MLFNAYHFSILFGPSATKQFFVRCYAPSPNVYIFATGKQLNGLTSFRCWHKVSFASLDVPKHRIRSQLFIYRFRKMFVNIQTGRQNDYAWHLQMRTLITYQLRHRITRVHSENLHQRVHPQRLISLRCPHEDALDPWKLIRPRVDKSFSCSTQLSMKFSLLTNMKR